MSAHIDVTFDFRHDTPTNGDPDALSPTLRNYHKTLWGRPLPNGRAFELDASGPIRACYLYHYSDLGEFHLSSDAVIPRYARWKRMRHIVELVPEEENQAFYSLSYTIGGMMVWPRRPVATSINTNRGTNPRISDRMDLTLECVRRFYDGRPSPLSTVLDANAEFFRLFGDFRGFVDHFLLQDLVTEDYANTLYFMHFDDFCGPSRPTNLAEYLTYEKATTQFIHARNKRILELSIQLWAPLRHKAS